MWRLSSFDGMMNLMKSDIYVKMQKQYGGKWVATSKKGRKVYVADKDINRLYQLLYEKSIKPQKTVIGYVEEPGTVSVYCKFSISL